jgi:DNA-directed RNA polymerase specialized sigma subunit
MTIEEIYKKGEISIRSYNVCQNNKLYSISDLTKYYYQNKSFHDLHNCGRRSNEELVGMFNKHQKEKLEELGIETQKEKPIFKIILGLTRVQREVINSLILVNTKSLSVRSRNAISSYLKGKFTIKYFAEKMLLSDNFNVSKIKNVGAKCVPELEKYISSIKGFLVEVSETKDENFLIALKNRFLIQRTYLNLDIPTEILESESIFLFVDYLVSVNALFNQTQTEIFKKSFKIYKDQKELTLDEIAKEVGLSAERVRQRKKGLLDEVFNKLLFTQNFNDDLFQKYNLDITSNHLDVNTHIVEIINSKNKTNLSKQFITYIVFAYLSNSFALVGNVEDVFQPKYFNASNRYNWLNFYIIKKELAYEIDFNALLNDIESRINNKIEETYTFNFKSYLSKFLTDNQIKSLNLIFPIAEKIINDEFELYLDLYENIIFKRNTARQVHEYTYEALEELGKPSKIKVIFEKVIELHPNYETEEAKIRSSLKRRNGFISIGRKSVHGLKKWEDELVNFKGGTIRNIVKEYLSLSPTPKHISDITEFVLKYRPKSNQNSILQNLKLDESGLYVFFKGSNIGLKSKKYQADFMKIPDVKKPEKKTWQERFEMLDNFTAIQKRQPCSSGVPPKEIRLYRWLNVQKNKLNKGKLDKDKEEELNNLLRKHPSINGKRKVNSNEKYEELISFVSTNHRLPSVSKNGEENLYHFLYKQRKLFDANELDSKEENKFIEVAKLHQNIKYEN